MIVADNGYSDIVEVIRGKMEEITLPVDYVDIIISEWMVSVLLDSFVTVYTSSIPLFLTGNEGRERGGKREKREVREAREEGSERRGK